MQGTESKMIPLKRKPLLVPDGHLRAISLFIQELFPLHHVFVHLPLLQKARESLCFLSLTPYTRKQTNTQRCFQIQSVGTYTVIPRNYFRRTLLGFTVGGQ